MADVLILMESQADIPHSSQGLADLRELGISFSLRIVSAYRSPCLVQKLAADFEAQDGKVLICFANKSAYLAGFVASLSTLPVISVPIVSQTGNDPINVQMPVAFPVATMGLGAVGFANACWLAAQILANTCPEIRTKLHLDRQRRLAQQIECDVSHRIDC